MRFIDTSFYDAFYVEVSFIVIQLHCMTKET